MAMSVWIARTLQMVSVNIGETIEISDGAYLLEMRDHSP
jgi:hypothetical protein